MLEVRQLLAEKGHRIFAIGTAFDRDFEAIGQDRRLSSEGKKEKAREHVQKAQRDLLGLQKSLDDYRKQTESLRSGMKVSIYDKSDSYAAGLRRELRDRAVAMTFGQKAALMSGSTRDFVDAVLEQAAWVSGFDTFNPNELELYEAAKAERLRDLHGQLIGQIEERDAVEREAPAVRPH